MHSFAPFSNLHFFVKLLRFFRQFFTFVAIFSMILLDFFEILLKFRWNFWKFHGNPLNLQISMNFRGCRDKTRIETRIETQRRPVVLPLRGAEVLVAVRGPSPGEGGREKTQLAAMLAPQRAWGAAWLRLSCLVFFLKRVN